MGYNIDINKEEINIYLEKIVDKVFAILGVFESCNKRNDFNDYYTYLERIALELKGCTYSLERYNFLSLYNTILGMSKVDELNHAKTKSLVFYCISLIKKMKVKE